MSVRLGLLALLAQEPMYGARLRAEFEARTGGTWPLNVGQVYTTLSRLERDGLVEAVGEDAEGRIAYRLTSAGRTEVTQWWTSPVDWSTRCPTLRWWRAWAVTSSPSCFPRRMAYVPANPPS